MLELLLTIIRSGNDGFYKTDWWKLNLVANNYYYNNILCYNRNIVINDLIWNSFSVCFRWLGSKVIQWSRLFLLTFICMILKWLLIERWKHSVFVCCGWLILSVTGSTVLVCLKRLVLFSSKLINFLLHWMFLWFVICSARVKTVSCNISTFHRLMSGNNM